MYFQNIVHFTVCSDHSLVQHHLMGNLATVLKGLVTRIVNPREFITLLSPERYYALFTFVLLVRCCFLSEVLISNYRGLFLTSFFLVISIYQGKTLVSLSSDSVLSKKI